MNSDLASVLLGLVLIVIAIPAALSLGLLALGVVLVAVVARRAHVGLGRRSERIA